jgi:hypothetical protein
MTRKMSVVSGGTSGPIYTRRHGLREHVQLAASISAPTLGAEALVWLVLKDNSVWKSMGRSSHCQELVMVNRSGVTRGR